MKKLYKLQAVTNFLASGLVVNCKVTRVEKVGFNDMEGSIYHVNVKLETIDGYKNKLVTFEINSTYMDDIEEYETIEQYIESLLFSYYVLN